MFKRREYRFTSKSHSKTGFMSVICGTLSVTGFIFTLIKVINDGGQAAERMGAAGFVSFLFCFAGLSLGIISMTEKDRFELLPRLGLGMSVLSAICWGAVLYAGSF